MAGIKNINELSELTSEAKSDIKRMLDINEQGGGGSDSGDNNSPWESGSGENSAQLKNSNSVASGDNSVAIGTESNAIGVGSYAEGNICYANGDYSHAEGDYTSAWGDYTHAEGCVTVAAADYSHAEGGDNSAYGVYSHVEGSQNWTFSTYAHAEGWGTIAGVRWDYKEEKPDNYEDAFAAHAEGFGAEAYGTGSHVEGFNTIASGKATHVGGRLNLDLNDGYNPNQYGDYAEIIGNGIEGSGYGTDVRSNARTLTWTGVEWTKGGFETDGSLTLGLGTADEVTLSASDLKQLLNLIHNN